MDVDTEAKTAIDTKLHLLDLHMQAEHAPEPAQTTPAPSAQPATHVWVDETREGWDNFKLNWAQYKEDLDIKGTDISRHLVAFCSKELQSVLSRNLGCQQFNTDEALLLTHMEQLALEFQNPAVNYVQEFLDIKQTPDEGIKHFLSRLKWSPYIATSWWTACARRKLPSWTQQPDQVQAGEGSPGQ